MALFPGYTPNEDDLITPNEIRTLMEKNLQKLKHFSQMSWDKEGSGSSYSEIGGINKADPITKLNPAPVDYDYLLYPTQVKCKIVQSWEHPCYCRVFVTNTHELPSDFRKILEYDNEVTPSKFKKYILPVFDRMVKEDRKLKKIKNKSSSPAYTVDYEYSSEQRFNIDWVPCLRIQELPDFMKKWKSKRLSEDEKMSCPMYVVSKTLITDYDELDLWRMSFSAFEKKILRDKCSWHERFILRYLKGALKELKEDTNTKKEDNWKICSYHVQTHCLHFFEKRELPLYEGGDIGEFTDYSVIPKDILNKEFGSYVEMNQGPLNIDYKGNLAPASWYREFKEYELLVYTSFYSVLQSNFLEHFFIPEVNLLQDVDLLEMADIVLFLNLQKMYQSEMDSLMISESFEAKRRQLGLIKRSIWSGLPSEMPT